MLNVLSALNKQKICNTLMLTLMLLALTAQTAFAATASEKGTVVPQIWVEGQVLNFNSSTGVPFVDANGRTQVPLRKALEALGAKVSWDPKAQAIGILFGEQQLGLRIGDKALTQGKAPTLTMDTAPLLKGGKVYLPIYPVVKALGGYVNWRPDVKAVTLTVNPKQWPLVSFVFGGNGAGTWLGRTITLRLNPDVTPITTGNFLALVNSGFYEGTIIHRVESGFVVQGGDPTGTGSGGPGATIKGEFSANGIDNPLRHLTGTLSMARKSSYDSAGSQYFICLNNQPTLDGQYAAFGEVIEGMDAVLALGSTIVDSKKRPLETVWIEAVKQVNAGEQGQKK